MVIGNLELIDHSLVAFDPLLLLACLAFGHLAFQAWLLANLAFHSLLVGIVNTDLASGLASSLASDQASDQASNHIRADLEDNLLEARNLGSLVDTVVVAPSHYGAQLSLCGARRQ